eukprot:jgi/Picsp_1/809/NSC_04298-R1_alpha beta hydrolase
MVGRFLGSKRDWLRCRGTSTNSARVLILGFCFYMVTIQPVVGQDIGSSQLKCEKAINMTLWALDESRKPAVDELSVEAAVEYAAQQPLTTDLISIMPQLSWAAFQVQAVLGGAPYGAAEAGEIFNVVNTLNGSNVLGNLTRYGDNIEEVYDIWRDAWVELANRLVAKAENPDNGLSESAKGSLFYRANQYYFVSQWPFPVSEGGLEAARNSTKAFDQYLETLEKDPKKNYTVEYLSIPFSNGTTSVELPGIFVSPDPSKKPPLVVLNTGTDYSKEAIFTFGGSQSLDNGYAVLAFDGPGQGLIKRTPPYMPLVPRWDSVIEAVLSKVEEDDSVNQYVNMDEIFVWGVSLGGYLVGQACSMLPKGRVNACIVNPGVVNMFDPYTDSLIQTFFKPLGQLNRTDIPDGYYEAFQNETTIKEQILIPLLEDCGPDSEAPDIWYQLFSGDASDVNIVPDYVYNAMDYAGVVTSNITQIVDSLWQGYGNVLQFINTNMSMAQTPFLILSGEQDNLIGGQSTAFLEQLPKSVKDQSLLVNFTAETGAALHCQAGAMHAQADAVFPWLEQRRLMTKSETTFTGDSESKSSSASSIFTHRAVGTLPALFSLPLLMLLQI